MSDDDTHHITVSGDDMSEHMKTFSAVIVNLHERGAEALEINYRDKKDGKNKVLRIFITDTSNDDE